MDYKSLKNYYYDNKENYNNLLKTRLNSYDLIKFPIYIRDYKNRKENQAFLVCSWEIMRIIENITKHLSNANRYFHSLPAVAQNYYINRCLIDEIQTTNEIEGVFSTKKEINEIYNSLAANKNLKERRFAGLIEKYMKLIQPDYELILSGSSDIRKLYDEIVKNEIPNDKQPDGNIFRSETVYVVSKTNQKRHEGVNPEPKIVEYIDQSIALLNNNELPYLVRVAAFHYFFGYIHPFYDGNGRINRFISSYLLSRHIDILLALDLSYVIKKNKSEYYNLFNICNRAINKGDITPFVIGFLEFAEKSAQYICKSLLTGKSRLADYQNQIHKNKLFETCGANGKQMIELFILNALFARAPFDIYELSEIMKHGKPWTTELINKLIAQDIPIVKGKDGKKKTYMLDLQVFEDLLDMA